MHAWYVTGDILETVTGQPEGAQPAGIQYDISAVKKLVPLTLSSLPGVLSHV